MALPAISATTAGPPTTSTTPTSQSSTNAKENAASRRRDHEAGKDDRGRPIRDPEHERSSGATSIADESRVNSRISGQDKTSEDKANPKPQASPSRRRTVAAEAPLPADVEVAG
jgi:hypothetical protein